MFGIIGKLAGGLVGGMLDKIGLGSIAPFVKLGLNALTGNWLGVAQDVFGLISKFKGNPLNQAATRPPLGNFDQPSNSLQTDQNSNGDTNSLDTNRLSDLFRSLSDLFKRFSGDDNNTNNANNDNSCQDGGINKILDALKTLIDSFSNNQLFNNRISISQFTNIQA